MNDELIFRVRADAQAAMAELRKVGAEFLAVRDKVEGAGTEMQRTTQALEVMRAGTVEAQQAALAMTNWLNKEGSAFDRLRASVDPAFAATMRYEQAVTEATRAEQLGIRSKEETAQVLGLLKARYDAEAVAAQRAGAATVDHGRSSRAAGYQIQNAAFQVGDFAVQVAAGTSASHAAAQQLPQLLGGFGIWGAVLGAAAAVIVPFIGYLYQLRDAEKAAGDANDAFGKTFDALKSDMAEATSLQSDYAEAVKSGNATVIAALEQEAQVRLKLLELDRLDLEESARLAQAKDAEAKADLDRANANVAARMAQIDALMQKGRDGTYAGGFATAEDEAAALVEVLQEETAELKKQQQIHARNSAEYNLLQAKIAATNERLRLTNALLEDMKDGTTRGEMAATALKTVIADIQAGMRGVVDAQPGESWLSAAIARAETLYGVVLRVFGLTSSMSGFDKIGLAAQYAEYGRGRQASQDVIRVNSPLFGGDNNPLNNDLPKSAGGSGGGAARNPLADLQQSGADTLNSLQLAIGAVNEKVQAGLMTTAEGVDAIDQATDKTANALADLIPQIEQIGGPAAKAAAEVLRAALKEMADGMSAIGKELSKVLSADFASAFGDLVSGTKSGKDAFRDMANSMIADLGRIAAKRFSDRFMTPIFDSILSGLGFAKGGVPSLGEGGTPMRITPYAKGGLPGISTWRNHVLEGPTFFANGGYSLGVAGEAGKEAIMPLVRGPGGSLGVANYGGGGGGVVVNVQTPPGGSAKVTERQQGGMTLIDVVVGAAKGAVLEDLARGGPISDAMSRNFGMARQGS